MPRRHREFSSAREAKEDSGQSPSPRNRPSAGRSAMLCGYCGPNNVLPRGYDYWETRYRCLQKGFGAGKFSERRKWQVQTGSPVDPEYPSRCPHVNGNNARIRNGRNRQNRRNNGVRSSFRGRVRRGVRSSRSAVHYSSSSSDDESSSDSENIRPSRIRRPISNRSRNRRMGSRSARRRVSR
jgi:hypothetical protein